MRRSLRLVGSPFILPPEVPKERFLILRKAFNEMFKDPQLISEWQKLTGEDAHPLFAEEQERAIREIPRDDEIIAFFNKVGDRDHCRRGVNRGTLFFKENSYG